MADNTNHTNTYRETRVEKSGSGSGGVIAFIVGGLVVAVAIIAFAFSNQDGDGIATPAGGEVNINVGDGDPGVDGPGVLRDRDPGVDGLGVIKDRGAPNN